MQQGSLLVMLLLKRWIRECTDEDHRKKLVELLFNLNKPTTTNRDLKNDH